MARERSVYRCQTCGFAASKAGTCPDCARTGTYVALVEERPALSSRSERPKLAAGARPVRIGEIAVTAGERIATGIGELDRVLGGGVVPGSLVLIGGDPGIGKSTLLLQASRRLAERGGRSSTSRAKSRPLRSSSAPTGSGSPRAISISWRKRISR